ncbi:hypothetical protein P9112_008863 [Eukaryota sp. TZLM1-RC]
MTPGTTPLFQQLTAQLDYINKTSNEPEIAAFTKKLDNFLELLYSHYLFDAVNALLTSKLPLLCKTPPESADVLEIQTYFLRFLSRIPLSSSVIVPHISPILSLLSTTLYHPVYPVQMASIDLFRTLNHRNFTSSNLPAEYNNFLNHLIPLSSTHAIFSNPTEEHLTFIAALIKCISQGLLQFIPVFLRGEGVAFNQCTPPVIVTILSFVSNHLTFLNHFLSLEQQLIFSDGAISPSLLKTATRKFFVLSVVFRRLNLIKDTLSKGNLLQSEYGDDVNRIIQSISSRESREVLEKSFRFLLANGSGGASKEFTNGFVQFLPMLFNPDWVPMNLTMLDDLLKFRQSKTFTFPVDSGSHSFLIDSRVRLIKLILDSCSRHRNQLSSNQLLSVFHNSLDLLFSHTLPSSLSIVVCTAIQSVLEPLCSQLCENYLPKDPNTVLIPDFELPRFKYLCLQISVVANSCVLKFKDLIEQVQSIRFYYDSIKKNQSDVLVNDPLIQSIPLSHFPNSGSFHLMLTRSSISYQSSYNEPTPVSNCFTTVKEGLKGYLNERIITIRGIIPRISGLFCLSAKLLSRSIRENSFSHCCFMSNLGSLIAEFLVDLFTILPLAFSELGQDVEPITSNSDILSILQKVGSILFTSLEPSFLFNSILPKLSGLLTICIKHSIFKDFLLEFLDIKRIGPVFSEYILDFLCQSISTEVESFSMNIPVNPLVFNYETLTFTIFFKAFLSRLSPTIWSSTPIDTFTHQLGIGVGMRIVDGDAVDPLAIPLIVRWTPSFICTFSEQIYKHLLNNVNYSPLVMFVLTLFKHWLFHMKPPSQLQINSGVYNHLGDLFINVYSLLLELWYRHSYSLLGFLALDCLINLNTVCFKLCNSEITKYIIESCSITLTVPFPFQKNLLRSCLMFLGYYVDYFGPGNLEKFLIDNSQLVLNLIRLVKKPKAKAFPLTKYAIQLLGKLGVVSRSAISQNDCNFDLINELFPQSVNYGPFTSEAIQSISFDGSFTFKYGKSVLEALKFTTRLFCSVSSYAIFPDFLVSSGFVTVPDPDDVISGLLLTNQYFDWCLGESLSPSIKLILFHCVQISIYSKYIFCSYNSISQIPLSFPFVSPKLDSIFEDEVVTNDTIFTKFKNKLLENSIYSEVFIDALMSISSSRIISASVSSFIVQCFAELNLSDDLISLLLINITQLSKSGDYSKLNSALLMVFSLLKAGDLKEIHFVSICRYLPKILSSFPITCHFVSTNYCFTLKEFFSLLLDRFTHFYPTLEGINPVFAELTLLFTISSSIIRPEVNKFLSELVKSYGKTLTEVLPKHCENLVKFVSEVDASNISQFSSMCMALSRLIDTKSVEVSHPIVCELLPKISARLRPNPNLDSTSHLLSMVEKERLLVLAKSSVIPFTFAATQAVELICSVFIKCDPSMRSFYLSLLFSCVLSSSEYFSFFVLRNVRRVKQNVKFSPELWSPLLKEIEALGILLSQKEFKHPHTTAVFLYRIKLLIPNIRTDYGSLILNKFGQLRQLYEQHSLDYYALASIRSKALSLSKLLSLASFDQNFVQRSFGIVSQLEQMFNLSPLTSKLDTELNQFSLLVLNLCSHIPNQSLMGESLRQYFTPQNLEHAFSICQIFIRILTSPQVIPTSLWTRFDHVRSSLNIKNFSQFLRTELTAPFIQILQVPYSNIPEIEHYTRHLICKIIYLISTQTSNYLNSNFGFVFTIVRNLTWLVEFDPLRPSNPDHFPTLDRSNCINNLVDTLILNINGQMEIDHLLMVCYLSYHYDLKYFVPLRWKILNFSSNLSIDKIIHLSSRLEQLTSDSKISSELAELFSNISPESLFYHCLNGIFVPWMKNQIFDNHSLAFDHPFITTLKHVIINLLSQISNSFATNPIECVVDQQTAIGVELVYSTCLLIKLCDGPLTDLIDLVSTFISSSNTIYHDVSVFAISLHHLKFINIIKNQTGTALSSLFNSTLIYCLASQHQDGANTLPFVRHVLFLALDHLLAAMSVSWSGDKFINRLALILYQNGNDHHLLSFIWMTLLQPQVENSPIKQSLLNYHQNFHIPAVSFIHYFTKQRSGPEQEVAILVCEYFLNWIRSRKIGDVPKKYFDQLFEFLVGTSLIYVKPQSATSNEVDKIDHLWSPFSNIMDLLTQNLAFYNIQMETSFLVSISKLILDLCLNEVQDYAEGVDINLIEKMFSKPKGAENFNVNTLFSSAFVGIRYLYSFLSSSSPHLDDLVTCLGSSLVDSVGGTLVSSFGTFSIFISLVLFVLKLVFTAAIWKNTEFFIQWTLKLFQSFVSVIDSNNFQVKNSIFAGLSFLYSNCISSCKSRLSTKVTSQDQHQDQKSNELTQLICTMYLLTSMSSIVGAAFGFVDGFDSLLTDAFNILMISFDSVRSTNSHTTDLVSNLVPITLVNLLRLISWFPSIEFFLSNVETILRLDVCYDVFSILIPCFCSILNVDLAESCLTMIDTSLFEVVNVSDTFQIPSISNFDYPPVNLSDCSDDHKISNVELILRIEFNVTDNPKLSLNVSAVFHSILLEFIRKNHSLKQFQSILKPIVFCLFRSPWKLIQDRAFVFVSCEIFPEFSSFDQLIFSLDPNPLISNISSSSQGVVSATTNTTSSYTGSGSRRFYWFVQGIQPFLRYLFQENELLVLKLGHSTDLLALQLFSDVVNIVDTIISVDPRKFLVYLEDITYKFQINVRNDSFYGFHQLSLTIITMLVYKCMNSFDIFPSEAFLVHLLDSGDSMTCFLIGEQMVSSSTSLSLLPLIASAAGNFQEHSLSTAIRSLFVDHLVNSIPLELDRTLILKSFQFDLFGDVEKAHYTYSELLKFLLNTDSNLFSFTFPLITTLTEKWSETACQMSRWDLITSFDNNHFLIDPTLPCQARLATGKWSLSDQESKFSSLRISPFHHLHKLYSSLNDTLTTSSPDQSLSISGTRRHSLEEFGRRISDDSQEVFHSISDYGAFLNYSHFSLSQMNYLLRLTDLISDSTFVSSLVAKISPVSRTPVPDPLVLNELKESLSQWRSNISNQSLLIDCPIHSSFVTNTRVQFLQRFSQLCSSYTEPSLVSLSSLANSIRSTLLLQFAAYLRKNQLLGPASQIHQILNHDTNVDHFSAVKKTVEEVKIYLAGAEMFSNNSDKRSDLLSSANDLLKMTNLDLVPSFAISEVSLLKSKLTNSLSANNDEACQILINSLSQNLTSFDTWFELGMIQYSNDQKINAVKSLSKGLSLTQSIKNMDSSIILSIIYDCIVSGSVYGSLSSEVKSLLLLIDWTKFVPFLLSKLIDGCDVFEFCKDLVENGTFSLKYSFCSSILQNLRLPFPPSSFEDLLSQIPSEVLGKFVTVIETAYPSIFDQFLEFFQVFDNSFFDFSDAHCIQIISQLRELLLNISNFDDLYSTINDLILALSQLGCNSAEVARISEKLVQNFDVDSLNQLITAVNQSLIEIQKQSFVRLPESLAVFNFDFLNYIFELKPNASIVGISSNYFRPLVFNSKPSIVLKFAVNNGDSVCIAVSMPPFAPAEDVNIGYIQSSLSSFILASFTSLIKNKPRSFQLLLTDQFVSLDSSFSSLDYGCVGLSGPLDDDSFKSIHDIDAGEPWGKLFSGEELSLKSVEERSNSNYLIEYLRNLSCSIGTFWNFKVNFSKSMSILTAFSLIFGDSQLHPSSFFIHNNGRFFHLPILSTSESLQSELSIRLTPPMLEVLGVAGADGWLKPVLDFIAKTLLKSSRATTLIKIFELDSQKFVNSCENLEWRDEEVKSTQILEESVGKRSTLKNSLLPWR